MDVVEGGLSGLVSRSGGGPSCSLELGRVSVLEQGERIRHADGHTMTKDGSKQSLSPKWHAAKERLLLPGDAHDGRQVEEGAFRGDERLSQLIDRSKGEGRKAGTGEVACRFRSQVQQACFVQLTAQGDANTIEGSQA